VPSLIPVFHAQDNELRRSAVAAVVAHACRGH